MVLQKPKFTDQRRIQIATFFKERRLCAGLSIEKVAQDLGLESPEVLVSYESGEEALPLDDVFALTNLLNIPPEDVLALVHDVYSQGS